MWIWRYVPTGRRQAVAAALAALVATTTVAGAGVASGHSARDRAAAGHWLPFAASAPCKGSARVAVRVSHNPRIHYPDLLRVRVTGAAAQSRWKVVVETRSGDMAGVTPYGERADRRGQWTVHGLAASGHTTVDVTAASGRGQRCHLTVRGQVGRSG